MSVTSDARRINGVPKPDYRGTTHGEVRTIEGKFNTGRRFPTGKRDGNGNMIFIPIKERREIWCWFWCSRRQDWLTHVEWLLAYPAPNAGKVSVTKHDSMFLALARRQKQARAHELNVQKRGRK